MTNILCPCCGAEIDGVQPHRNGRPWLPEQVALIERCRRAGLTRKQIAILFQVGPDTITKVLEKWSPA